MKAPRRGMIMVLVVGVLVFVTIVFASMVNRVRQENVLTTRTSINEQLYQLASSIGRITVRKLQKDLETWDNQENHKIFDIVFKGARETEVKCTGMIEKLDVIQAIIGKFAKTKTPLSLDVKYTIEIDEDGFSPDLIGLSAIPQEKKGFINVSTVVTIGGFSKKCVIKKQFYVTRLMAPFFHKFTLFSTRGASIEPKKVNRLEKIESVSSNEIRYQDDAPPLVIFNRRITDQNENRKGQDFRRMQQPAASSDDAIITPNSLEENGWVFLGGSGQSADLKGDRDSLILNVCAGSNHGIQQKYFGEYFHFYYSDDSTGWVAPDKWNNWVNSKIPGNDTDPLLTITFVDFGHIARDKISFMGRSLFAPTLKWYADNHSRESWANGSALHLFGTPSICTPTLVFGKVKRRYLRVHGFLLKPIERVYPVSVYSKSEWEGTGANDGIDQEIVQFLEKWGCKRDANAVPVDKAAYFFSHDLTYQLYSRGDTDKNYLMPFFIDWEPYVYGLRTIAKPKDPADPKMSWGSVFQGSKYLENPQKLYKNFQFTNDPFLKYSGCLEDVMALPAKFLAEKTSYYFSDDTARPAQGGKTVKFSQANNPYMALLKEKRCIDFSAKPASVYLNQIIRFKDDLEIDIPLDVMKGGIIICDGKITIKAPIKNRWQPGVPQTIPDAFGYLTLIARNGIDVNLDSAPAGRFGYPELHAFLIALGNGDKQVKVIGSKPVHFVGGIATDKIDSLVEKGGIIEWGFDPKELAGDKAEKEASFFGLSMGPRDIELVLEDK
jgi:hypothetical protein